MLPPSAVLGFRRRIPTRFRQIRELEDIDRALAKVASREYGRCERCRRPIAPERLQAAPAAR
jgi:RNA polymerase-binding transcription factor DksA